MKPQTLNHKPITPWGMDDGCTGNTFPLGFSSHLNHNGLTQLLRLLPTYQQPTNPYLYTNYWQEACPQNQTRVPLLHTLAKPYFLSWDYCGEDMSCVELPTDVTSTYMHVKPLE
jgi:hypothetical protein